jgi:hypothetical protein
MTRVGIIQSNYIPWKGYFDIIHDVDLFVFYDDVQYTKNDWRNRNRIKTEHGERWLTIPVGKRESRRICDVALPSSGWARDHWRRLEAAYRRAPYFEVYRAYFEEFYLRRPWSTLSEFNQALVTGIARDLLGITTPNLDSRTFHLTQSKGGRVVELLQHVGASVYVSGPSAKAYITDEGFLAAGIKVEWKNYQGYPEYDQFHGPFVHAVTILDLLFHTGPLAPYYIWGWRAAGRVAA